MNADTLPTYLDPPIVMQDHLWVVGSIVVVDGIAIFSFGAAIAFGAELLHQGVTGSCDFGHRKNGDFRSGKRGFFLLFRGRGGGCRSGDGCRLRRRGGILSKNQRAEQEEEVHGAILSPFCASALRHISRRRGKGLLGREVHRAKRLGGQ